MRRRDFLKVVGLSVATPSLLVAGKGPPPKRQNPDVISTGFPTIDDAFYGGWHRGTFNMLYRRANRIDPHDLRPSDLMKSMALKAASNLDKRSAVLLVCDQVQTTKTQGTPFDGLLTITKALPHLWHFRQYDLIMIDIEDVVYNHMVPHWKELSAQARWFHQMAHEHNCVVVKRGKMGYPDHYGSRHLLSMSHSQMYSASSALIVDSKHEPHPPTLEILKNRWGPREVKIEIVKPSMHFYQEALTPWWSPNFRS